MTCKKNDFRPIPSLAPPEKAAATVLTRGASFVLIGFLVATIVLFAVLGIVRETSRIIHLVWHCYNYKTYIKLVISCTLV
jgi:hypothetical protein